MGHVELEGHRVGDVVVDQVEPVLVAALVEQVGLVVEHVGDLLLEQQPSEPLSVAASCSRIVVPHDADAT